MSATDRVHAWLWRACRRLASPVILGGGLRAEVVPRLRADTPSDGPPFVDTVAGWRAV